MVRTKLQSALAAACLLHAPLLPAAAPQQPQPARVVTGVAIDEAGEPVSGAAVTIEGYNSAVDLRAVLKAPPATTDDDGRFTLPVPDSIGRSPVVLVAHRRLQACARIVPSIDDDRVDLGQFVLPPGASLVGRVRDEHGEPLAGVQVRVADAIHTRSYQQNFAMSGAISNERGIFQVPCVPRTGLQLTLSKQGYVVEEQLASHGTPLSLTMRPAPLARGRVQLADGTPLADASVTVLREGPGTQFWPTQRTDADGAFTITVPPAPLRYRVLATEAQQPHRRFESDLLRGGHEELVLTEIASAATGGRALVVRVVDKETGEALPHFEVAPSSFGVENVQVAMFHAEGSWQDYEGEASIALRDGGPKGLLVRAPGHGFEVATIPDDLDVAEPLVVELGPEAIVQGRVVDENGDPVVGVAVRALPDGNASGSGGRISAFWPRTDKDGRYRIRGLRPGAYDVQAYPDAHPASKPFQVEAKAGEEVSLDLTMPVLRELIVELTGAPPAGPAQILRINRSRSGTAGGGFRHSIEMPAPRTLRADERSFPFGAVTGGTASFELFVPSRTRVGAGTMLNLNGLPVEDGRVKVELPKLARHVVRGRIEGAGELPTERVAVLATPIVDRVDRFGMSNDKTVSGVFSDGTFAIDLPAGSYCMQLADVTTGIVFHTEAEDFVAGSGPLAMRPQLHWLDLALTTEGGGAVPYGVRFTVTLDRPRDGT
ncbi:MAG: carboxypeptidase regulatory-like domain-containing protein, partial [Planctomycetes bacterium]|nr:carboxypeptidase regulatory-like domain-containing protein [Planctomycetota bacterium]